MRIRSRYSIPSLFAVLLCGLALSFAPIQHRHPSRVNPGSCRARPTASPIFRALEQRDADAARADGQAGRDPDDRGGGGDRGARARWSRSSATRRATRIARRRSKAATGRSLAAPGQPSFIEQIAEAAGGKVGGYNGFWLDPGNSVIRIDGVARSSIIVDPPDGRLPALTAEGKQRLAERAALAKKFGEFDHPEMRPLSDRCLLSFGSNAGPPMLPNYFYNNNYTIVQTKDHMMILTEMVHDVRIIRLGATEHLPPHVRPWMGDSIGRWEGDTLVVETTNIHPLQLAQPPSSGAYRGASDKLKVTERFTRTGPDTLLYKFTMEDPSTFTRRSAASCRSIASTSMIFDTRVTRGTTR